MSYCSIFSVEVRTEDCNDCKTRVRVKCAYTHLVTPHQERCEVNVLTVILYMPQNKSFALDMDWMVKFKIYYNWKHSPRNLISYHGISQCMFLIYLLYLYNIMLAFFKY